MSSYGEDDKASLLNAMRSGGKADLLSVIQKHIASSMEADREAQRAYQEKVDELQRTKELNTKLQNELSKVSDCGAYPSLLLLPLPLNYAIS